MSTLFFFILMCHFIIDRHYNLYDFSFFDWIERYVDLFIFLKYDEKRVHLKSCPVLERQLIRNNTTRGANSIVGWHLIWYKKTTGTYRCLFTVEICVANENLRNTLNYWAFEQCVTFPLRRARFTMWLRAQTSKHANRKLHAIRWASQIAPTSFFL